MLFICFAAIVKIAMSKPVVTELSQVNQICHEALECVHQETIQCWERIYNSGVERKWEGCPVTVEEFSHAVGDAEEELKGVREDVEMEVMLCMEVERGWKSNFDYCGVFRPSIVPADNTTCWAKAYATCTAKYNNFQRLYPKEGEEANSDLAICTSEPRLHIGNGPALSILNAEADTAQRTLKDVELKVAKLLEDKGCTKESVSVAEQGLLR